MSRGTDGPTERQLGEAGPEGVVCKRGLTRDACLGEAITRRAAGAALERGTTLALPPCPPPPLPHLCDPPSRTTVPTSPFPDNPLKHAPKSPSGGVEPPRRLNLPASASNPTSSGPPSSLLSLSLSLRFLHLDRQYLPRPLLLRAAEKRKHKKIIPLSLSPDAAAADAAAAEQPLDPPCLIPCLAAVGYSGPRRASLRGTMITPRRGTTTADKTRREARRGASRCVWPLALLRPFA